VIRFEESIDKSKIRFSEEKAILIEAGILEVPKIVAQDVKYWDSLPLKTKDEFMASYGKLEDVNDSPGCAYLIAKFAKDKKVLQAILYINAIHFVFGSIPYDLQKLRYELTNPLYKKIAGQK
jgi:hypothetical protein